MLITVLLFSTNSFSQYYEWAFAPGLLARGASGSFKSTDMHGNAYFIGIDKLCMTCLYPVIKCYDPSGQMLWNIELNGSLPPIIYAVDADSANNRYVLMEFQTLPSQLGNFTINDPYCLVKYNSSATPVRITVLPERYTQVKTDSVGNAFVSTGTTVRRYNKFGQFSWEYPTGITHQLFLDIYKNVYLYDDNVAIKLNPSGMLKYTINELGPKTYDPKGRLYVSTSLGLKKYDKVGIFQWLQPAISGAVQVNLNGNIYAFRNDSVIKYNQAGSIVQWSFENAPSAGIVNRSGDVFFGGTYDPFDSNFQLCPFRLPSLGILAQYNNSQVWVAKLNGKDPMPFQAAVYTGVVRNSSTDNNNLCTSAIVSGGSGPLFEYCTNANSSFNPGNDFSLEVSDAAGNFINAINIGDPAINKIPDSIPYGTTYRIRVVSSTPGVTYHANLPFNYNSDVTIFPNKADLSLTGTQNLCEGFVLQLSIETGDPNAHISWADSINYLPNYQDSTQITIDTAGYYYATVSNYICLRQTDTVFVNLNPRPNPSVIPSGPTTFCQGDSVILAVDDSDLNIIKWRLNGTNIPGYHDTTLTVNTAGSYSARITNIYGCARTSSPVDVVIPCREGQFPVNTIADVTIYPNPVSDYLIVNLPDYAITPEFEMFDQIGHLVHINYKSNGNNFIIDTRELAKGIYFLRMISDGEVQKFKILKM